METKNRALIKLPFSLLEQKLGFPDGIRILYTNEYDDPVLGFIIEGQNLPELLKDGQLPVASYEIDTETKKDKFKVY